MDVNGFSVFYERCLNRFHNFKRKSQYCSDQFENHTEREADYSEWKQDQPENWKKKKDKYCQRPAQHEEKTPKNKS
jgi:hypothetical protein